MEITFETIFRVLRKSFLYIVLFALAAAIISFVVFSYLVPPTYVAKTEINLIGNENDITGSVADGNNSWVFANRLLKTSKKILDSRDFALEIKEAAGIDYIPKYTIKYEEDTTIVLISVTDRNPENAYKIAQAIADKANGRLANITLTSVSVVVNENPVLPTEPSSPTVPLFTLVAAVATVLIVVVIQILREALGTKVKDEIELANRYNIPVLASIPDFNEAMRNGSKYSYSKYYVKGDK